MAGRRDDGLDVQPGLSPSSSPVPRAFSPSPSRDPDAGVRDHNHYQRRLPRWRYALRQWLIPVLRWETPYLARIQQACRSPLLDSYFAFTANLGTHTFFMTFLPICFWCGYAGFGISLVHMLALGVYASGALKDLLCLPRPLSPPLQRITMSGSAALEYGFPSTHTTNAVSVAVFCFQRLYESREDWSPTSYALLCLACLCYATSITLGRVYCGMHGFSDVGIGAVIGALIAWVRIVLGPAYDVWILSGSWVRPAISVAVLAAAVRFHPEPADNCPCFDDSVAFLGVVMGAEIGTWRRAETSTTLFSGQRVLALMYPYDNQNLLKSAARLVGGIMVIFVWRAVMKPLLLGFLPSLFRAIDQWGLMIPRRYFLQARDYKEVPDLPTDDNVIPSASRIPSILSAIRNPRKRRVSVGPQSEADAREHIANRREQRRSSRSASSLQGISASSIDSQATSKPSRAAKDVFSPLQASNRPTASPLQKSNQQVSYDPQSLLTPPMSETSTSSDSSGREDDVEMFAALQKPRTKYDAEVITKLVVYAGIAWLAVDLNPSLFEVIGLA